MPTRPSDHAADHEPRDGVLPVRLSAAERSRLDDLAARLGVPYTADAIRAAPLLWEDRRALLRAALEPLRGTMTRVEVDQVARHVHDVGTLTDGSPAAPLARRLADLPLVARIALELWAADLWQRHEDDEHWERELAWLAQG